MRPLPLIAFEHGMWNHCWVAFVDKAHHPYNPGIPAWWRSIQLSSRTRLSGGRECGGKRCYRMIQSCDQDLGRVESVAREIFIFFFPTISGVKISKIQLSQNPRSWIHVLKKHIQTTDPSWQNSAHFADTAPTGCKGRESGEEVGRGNGERWRRSCAIPKWSIGYASRNMSNRTLFWSASFDSRFVHRLMIWRES